MDSKLRKMIADEVAMALKSVLATQEERWLSAEQLEKQFACLTPGWQRNYAKLLPRTQAVVVGADGKEHKSGWVYPLHKIQQMFLNGEIKNLRPA